MESRADLERARLENGPRPGELPLDAGVVDVVGLSHGDAAGVDVRVREVLSIIAEHQNGRWPNLDEWKLVLPRWFTAFFVEQRTQNEESRPLDWRRALPAEQQASVVDDKKWTLSAWLFWLQPDERQWYFWDSRVESKNQLRVQVQIVDYPLLGALEWLLRSAGARDVVALT